MTNSHGSRYEVRCLPESEYAQWDAFVEDSPQGTIFCTTTWLKIFLTPFKLFGCYRDDELIGGLPVLERRGICLSGGPRAPLIPFQGVIVCDVPGMKYANVIAFQNEVTGRLIETLEQTYRDIEIANHFSFIDIRPFIWAGYSQLVRYTYIVDLSNLDKLWGEMEKDTRYEINKARKNEIVVKKQLDVMVFDRLYTLTFERKGLKRRLSTEFICRLYNALKNKDCVEIYLGEGKDGIPSAAVFVMWDTKRAYYILGASNPDKIGDGASSLTLWTAFEDLSSRFKEIDLVGANDYNIALFKRGFGGRLAPYFVVSKRIPKDRQK